MKDGQPIKDKIKLKKFKTKLKSKGSRPFLLYLIGFNLGIKLERLINLTIVELNKIISERKRDIIRQKAFKNEINKYLSNINKEKLIFSEINDRDTLEDVYNVLKFVANQIYIDNFGWETLRKTYGFFHYQKFQDIERLRKILGLVSPTATLHYIGYDDDRHLCFHCNINCIYGQK